MCVENQGPELLPCSMKDIKGTENCSQSGSLAFPEMFSQNRFSLQRESRESRALWECARGLPRARVEQPGVRSSLPHFHESQ